MSWKRWLSSSWVCTGLVSRKAAWMSPPCFWDSSCRTLCRVAAMSTRTPVCSWVKVKVPVAGSYPAISASLASTRQVLAASCSFRSPCWDRSTT